MTDTLEQRLAAVEAELAIRNLIVRYSLVMDDRDVDAIPGLFTKNARVWTGDGVMDACGRDDLVKLYEGRFAMLGATSHIVHGTLIEIDGPKKAHGVVTSTAEVWRNGTHQLASLRYNDIYEVEDGAWRIAGREMLYFYYVPLSEYPGVLGTIQRNRTYDEPMEADFPEKTAGFIKYLATH